MFLSEAGLPLPPLPPLTLTQESDSLTGGSTLTTFEAPFGKIGLGICYDVRFPEMAMVAARQGGSELSFIRYYLRIVHRIVHCPLPVAHRPLLIAHCPPHLRSQRLQDGPTRTAR